jgi:hypothetical protein
LYTKSTDEHSKNSISFARVFFLLGSPSEKVKMLFETPDNFSHIRDWCTDNNFEVLENFSKAAANIKTLRVGCAVPRQALRTTKMNLYCCAFGTLKLACFVVFLGRFVIVWSKLGLVLRGR